MPDRRVAPRPRVPLDVAERIDLVRGDVPFERWVLRALEKALSEANGAKKREQAGPGPVSSLEGVRPAASSQASESSGLVSAGVNPVVRSPKPAPARASSCPECGSLGRMHQRGCSKA